MVDEIRVTIVATGIGEPEAPEIQISPRPQTTQTAQPGLQPINTSFSGLETRTTNYGHTPQDASNLSNHNQGFFCFSFNSIVVYFISNDFSFWIDYKTSS